jgi:peptidoglycan/LPS O-acetylase OafA/YrhL
MGVELFFIISGFVIFMTVQNMSKPKDFLKGRFWRLYPTYWAAVVVSAVVIVLNYSTLNEKLFQFTSKTQLITTVLANATMFQYFMGAKHLDGSFWTLTLELQFYIFIFLLLFFKKLHYYKIIGLIILACIAVLNTFYTDSFAQKTLEYLPILRYFPLFFCGMLLFQYSKTGQKKDLWLIGLSYLVLIGVFNKMHWHEYQLLSFTSYSIVLGLIYLCFFSFLHFKIYALRSKILICLGQISYSLYCLHQLLGRHVLIPFLNKYFPFIISFSISAVLVVSLAYLLNYYIELPFLHYYKAKKARI